MNTTTIFLIVDAIIFIILIYFVVRNGRKGLQLVRSINHFNEVSGIPVSGTEYIADIVRFEQKYSKTLKLSPAREDQYKEEIARQISLELLKNGAITIEFIYGIEEDTIKAKCKYMVEV